MTKVRVFHNISRDAGFGLNETFSQAGKSYSAKAHELVPVFEFDTAELLVPGQENLMPTHGEIMADIVFRAFNVGDDPLMTSTASREYAVATKYRARRLRSLSVGDVLSFDAENYLACESFGWKRVAEDELLVLDAQAAEPVIRKRYDFEPGEDLTVTVPLPQEG